MHSYFRPNKQKGIGLLELMLSMVIIAILTLMSIQYFGSSKMNTQTTQGVDQIQDIISIVAGFPNPVQIQKNNNKNRSKNNLNNPIIMSGTLPEKYIHDADTIITPWTSSTGSSPNYTVTVSGDIMSIKSSSDLPNWAAQSLMDKFRAEAKSVDYKNGVLTLTFELDANEGLV